MQAIHFSSMRIEIEKSVSSQPASQPASQCFTFLCYQIRCLFVFSFFCYAYTEKKVHFGCRNNANIEVCTPSKKACKCVSDWRANLKKIGVCKPHFSLSVHTYTIMRYLFSRPKKIENSKPNPGHILFTIISRCPIHTHKHIENFKRLAFRFSILNVYGNKFHRFFLATFFLCDSHE